MWFRPTIRAQLFLLIAAVGMPMAAIFMYATYDNIAQRSESVRAAAASLAELAANDAAAAISSARDVLQLLATRPQVLAFDPADCDPLLRDGTIDVLVRYANLTTLGPGGQVLCSRRPAPSTGVRSVADTEWFRTAVARKLFYASKPFLGHFSGRMVSVFTLPVFAPDGALRGAVTLPALMILDLNLPKISGLEVLRRVRADERTRYLPIVILTTSIEEQDVIDGYALGANAYARKPVAFEEFLAAASRLGLFWLTVNVQPPAGATPSHH